MLASAFGCVEQTNNSQDKNDSLKTHQEPMNLAEQIKNENNIQQLYGVILLGCTPNIIQVENNSNIELMDYPYQMLTLNLPDKISVLVTTEVKGLAENIKYDISYFPLPNNYELTYKDLFSIMKQNPEYTDLTYNIKLDSNIEGIITSIKTTK